MAIKKAMKVSGKKMNLFVKKKKEKRGRKDCCGRIKTNTETFVSPTVNPNPDLPKINKNNALI